MSASSRTPLPALLPSSLESCVPDVQVAADGVVTLTLNGGGALNLLSSPVIQAATQTLSELAKDAALRVLVLRGQGNRAFCAGAHIQEMGALGVNSASVFIDGLRQLIDAVRHFPTPVIARVPGYCFGGGLELVAGCDLRIAADTAVFAMPEVEIGIPSIIQAALLPRLIGQGRASWLLLTGERIDAAKGQQWGLVEEVYPLDELDARVAARASRMASFGPQALRQQKRLLREWQSQDLETAIVGGVREFAAAFLTGEPQHHMQPYLKTVKR